MAATTGPSSNKGEDYYAILGVDRTATEVEIKQAYRKLALELHPDKNPDPAATVRFQSVNKAHHVLSDEKLRSTYDLLGAQGADMVDQCQDYGGTMGKMSKCQKFCCTFLCCSTGCCFGGCCCCFCGCFCCCNFCCNHCCGLKKRPNNATNPSDEHGSSRTSSIHRQPTDSARY